MLANLPVNIRDISIEINNKEIPLEDRRKKFMANFAELMKIDIAAGQASLDTISTYMNQLQLFFDWAREELHKKPLQIDQNDILLYRYHLYNDLHYKQTTVALKLSVLRRFFQVAVRNNILKVNPCQDVYAGANRQASDLSIVRSLTLSQITVALHEMRKLEKTEVHLRNMTMFCLMLLQGWRTVEVYRASVEDIDFEKSIILVHGKRRDRFCNPRVDVMELLVEYLNLRPTPPADEYGVPLFTSISNNSYGTRITRYGIRMIIDQWLEQLEYKIPGFSCHGLRHTFGTQLFAQTRDPKVVAEEMGHANVNQTMKYVHIVDRQLKRLASAIPVKIELPTDEDQANHDTVLK